MYEHVLVPIMLDHGSRGTDALKIADELVAEGGKITLLHVLEDVPAYVVSYIPEGIRDTHRQVASEKLGELAKAVRADSEIAIIHGHASNGIMDYAQGHDVSCIVIASHKPGFEDYFLGSTAARVVRHAQCSVHVLR